MSIYIKQTEVVNLELTKGVNRRHSFITFSTVSNLINVSMYVSLKEKKVASQIKTQLLEIC